MLLSVDMLVCSRLREIHLNLRKPLCNRIGMLLVCTIGQRIGRVFSFCVLHGYLNSGRTMQVY